MPPFPVAALVGGLGVVALFVARHGRRIASAVAVVLALQTLLAVGLEALMGPVQPLAWALQVAVWAWLVRAAVGRMPSRAWSWLVGIPAQVWVVTTFLALPWSVLGATTGLWILPILALAGLYRSTTTRKELVRIDLGVAVPEAPGRFPAMVKRSTGWDAPREGLRIAHVTDPHLGSFMSVERLEAICRRAVDAKPDLILLGGDFLTFESNRSPDALTRALAPLRDHPHVYACRGNHDLEAADVVATALGRNGVRLLIDEAVTVGTPVGPVQIVGVDFRWTDRARHLRRVLVELRRPAGLRIVLLHDPGAFAHLAPGAADLVLSGHTHGGHVGLLDLGLPWTVVSGLVGLPDHGPYTQNGNRLYVNRAAGHYGFQLRLGVAAEESILHVVPVPAARGPHAAHLASGSVVS